MLWFLLAAVVLTAVFTFVGLTYNRDTERLTGGAFLRHRVLVTTAKVLGVVLAGLLLGAVLGLTAGVLLGS